MRYAWTLAALVLALMLQSALGILAPVEGRVVDPFLFVVVYCALTGGESQGMLSGMAAGWIQDVHFGGPIMGLSALTKLVIGFGVGVGGSRFLITGTVPRLFTLFVAAIADAILFGRLALVFEVPAATLTLFGLLTRATVNALVGAVAFEAVDLRLRRREARL